MRLSSIAKQKERGLDSSSLNSLNLPVHTIQPYITSWVAQFVNYFCPIRMRMKQFCHTQWRWCRHNPFLCNSSRIFACRCLHCTQHCFQFSLSTSFARSSKIYNETYCSKALDLFFVYRASENFCPNLRHCQEISTATLIVAYTTEKWRPKLWYYTSWVLSKFH